MLPSAHRGLHTCLLPVRSFQNKNFRHGFCGYCHVLHIPSPLFFAWDSSLPKRFQSLSLAAQPLATTHCRQKRGYQ